ncbi:ROK family protein [Kribbella sp.]|uniref:ROK family protein n=1 Tax=Kribbella sp. TaxID=1871183 RepID=UPI002D650215|nr:ROK family protein [Kribbella sp.]HZX06662.1 ROK family protein [Kribbella sp.]
MTPSPPLRQSRHVVGIDIGGTKIEVALADRSGRILDRIRLETRAAAGPEQALERIVAAVGTLAELSERSHGTAVGGYAAVCPGVIRPDEILFAPNLPGWQQIPLAARLQTALGVPDVPVANDVQAGAYAELRFGALKGVDPGVYVSLGTGVAAAVTTAGEVLTGAHQAAGEIGYFAVGSDTPVDVVAGRAPLEELVGGKALGVRASEVLGAPVTAAELFARTDKPARKLTAQALDTLGAAIANIAILLDPERVVIGGGLMASADVILPAVADRLARAVPFPPELLAARFIQDASLHGAVALALHEPTGIEPVVPAH